MTVLASLLLTLLGLGLIALAYPRHHRQAFGRPPAPKAARLLLAAGGLALAPAAVLAAAAGAEPAIGLVLWLFAALPLEGLLVVCLLSALPEEKRRA